MKILDCTLRDGGYYNSWDFSKGLVERYLRVMSECSVDCVELGFRFVDPEGFVGPYGFTADHWIRELDVPEELALGVMCNAKDFISGQQGDEIVRQVFASANKSPVSLVRLAAHFKEVESCEAAVRALAALGYRVGLNLMQTGSQTLEEIAATAQKVADWPLDVLYFADSLGDMQQNTIRQTIHALRQGWNGDLGFHSHDNMGLALINTLTAYEEGVDWLDATVMGMGRGAGNVRLEYLLLELNQRQVRTTDIDALLEFVVDDFQPLQAQYGWGPNLFYYLSAMYGVHPTYVQDMLGDGRYGHDQVIAALQRLGTAGATGYSPDRLRAAMVDEITTARGSWDVSGWLEGREILVVGAGEQGQKHVERLRQFIEERKPYVLCLNSNPWLDAEHIDAWVACNTQRMLLDRDYYAEHQGTLVAPRGLLPDDLAATLEPWQLLDYGMDCVEEQFSTEPTTAIIPRPLAVLYALALANAGGAAKIWLVGLDGFDRSDPRHHELEDALVVYRSQDNALPLTALTPTTLSVSQKSLYDPRL